MASIHCLRELLLITENEAISATHVPMPGIAHSRAVHHGLIFLIMISGTAALIYQICWQRLLFEGFGVDMESVTIVVSTFMLGLGLGALAGGEIADRFPGRAIPMFAMIELTTGAFGVCSPYPIRAISAATVRFARHDRRRQFRTAVDTDDVDGRYSANSCHSRRASLSKPRCVGRRPVFRQHVGSRIWSRIHRFRSHHFGLTSAIYIAAALNAAVGAAVWLAQWPRDV